MSHDPAEYERKKLVGLCQWDGCAAAAEDGASFCSSHLKRKRAALRDRKQKERRRAKRLGRCSWCSRRSAPGHRLCLHHLAYQGRLRQAVVVRAAVRSKAERITSATVVDGDGRTRYRGTMQRGRISAAVDDTKDIDEAARLIERAKAERPAIEALRAAGMTRGQIAEAEGGHLSLVHRAYRALGDLLQRRGYLEQTDPDDDDGEDGASE